ncbi:universal stress protein [Modestobacter sp. VKM Ac-2978]|uniref:universal stress protein n=1 Tax=Modestobacter sp. VKM Ac-2978 TaxID=3004132 RepID=UPI0022AB42F0|nr:universal stress protein [Modestobacter sp. VKM Ac-2978]MCZ2849746.1 universal stress protein [Modestobacter sp. VKM Ac-2978]
MTSSPASRPTIVVGVDGSPSSTQALRWALSQAALTSGEVHAVSVWHLPTTAGWETVLDAVDWAGNARLALDTAMAAAAADGASQVHRHVVEGHPARALVEAAADADLLVVGNRGRGAFSGMLLGSVGLHVLAHAPCPVVVVHGDRLPSGHETAAAMTTAPAR